MEPTSQTGADIKRPDRMRLPVAFLAAIGTFVAVEQASAQSATATLPSSVQNNQLRFGAVDTASTALASDPENATQTTDAITDPQAADPLTTGDIAADNLDMQRLNLRQSTLDDDGLPNKTGTVDPTGVRIGTMILRPTLSEKLLHETTRSAGSKQQSLYSETELKGTLTSDWSSHELSVSGQGNWQETLSGPGTSDPTASLDAKLRLDLADDTTATLSTGYAFSREDADDADAVANAETQYGIHRLNAGIAVERDMGRLRGTMALDGMRWLYSDAVLTNGTHVSLSDRERTLATLRTRIGYEISPALIPFIEVSAGRLAYDERTDALGYRRSADIYAGKGGLAVDFGEKLKGELSLGYTHEAFDDARLAAIDAMTIDGSVNWSPRYGTDVNLGLSTSLDPATTAGTSGSTVYTMNAGLTQQLRDNLVATLTSSAAWTRYPTAAASNSVTYTADAGLALDINRYLALTAGVGYEYTDRKSSADTEILRASIGLAAKR